MILTKVKDFYTHTGSLFNLKRRFKEVGINVCQFAFPSVTHWKIQTGLVYTE